MPNYTGLVTGYELYRSDVKIIRRGVSTRTDPPERGIVTTFTRRSRQRLAFVANNTDVRFTSMLTLTYPSVYPGSGKRVKAHLNAFLTRLRQRIGKMSYLWFLEFQKRGAPHVHVLLTGFPANFDNRQWVSRAWYDICQSGDPNHLLAGTRLERIRKQDGARRYAVKYASKMRQKAVPEGFRDVGRFWGHSRDVKPTPRAMIPCTHDDIVGSLLEIQWPWLRGDVVWYSILYNVSQELTALTPYAIVELAQPGAPTKRQPNQRSVKSGLPQGTND